MRRFLRFLAAFSVAALPVASAPSAGAAPSEGCGGEATSVGRDGLPVDTLFAPDSKTGTESNPFDIDYDGAVAFNGSTDSVIRDGRWSVGFDLPLIPSLSGDFDNDDGATTWEDEVKVSDKLPIKITGKFKVEGTVTGQGGRCTVSVWVNIDENPIFTPLWLAAAVMLLLSILFFFLGMPMRGSVA